MTMGKTHDSNILHVLQILFYQKRNNRYIAKVCGWGIEPTILITKTMYMAGMLSLDKIRSNPAKLTYDITEFGNTVLLADPEILWEEFNLML